jgi:hypothetical protein
VWRSAREAGSTKPGLLRLRRPDQCLSFQLGVDVASMAGDHLLHISDIAVDGGRPIGLLKRVDRV